MSWEHLGEKSSCTDSHWPEQHKLQHNIRMSPLVTWDNGGRLSSKSEMQLFNEPWHWEPLLYTVMRVRERPPHAHLTPEPRLWRGPCVNLLL